jgi:hypothetical protein
VTRRKQLRTGKPVFDVEFVLLHQQREMAIQKQGMKELKEQIDLQGKKMDTQSEMMEEKMDKVMSMLERLANKVTFASDVGKLESDDRL